MNATATIAPAPQHMQALQRANAGATGARRPQAAGRRREITAAEVILESPWEAEAMTVADLLTSQRRWGSTRCRRFLQAIPMSETEDDRVADRAPAPPLAPPAGSADGFARTPDAASGLGSAGRASSRSPDVRMAGRGRRPPRRGSSASRSRRCGRRDRAGRSSGSRRARRRPCTAPRASAGSRATPPAPRPSSTPKAKWWVEPVPTVPWGIAGYSRNETSVPGVPVLVAEPEVARVGIVVVDRLADEREPEQVAVERRSCARGRGRSA